jgi:5-methylcytosine-specific restriction protein A
MTYAPKHPCRHPGCSALIPAGGGAWCATHARQSSLVTRHADRARGSAYERGYDSVWRTASRAFLSRFPLCPGVMLPTPHWSRELAEEFHRIRCELQEAGTLLLFSQETAAGRFLAAHPIYRVEPWDIARPAYVVDHIIPHKGNQELFWAEWNWQPLTKRGHDRKTAKEQARGQRSENGFSR